MLAYRAIKFVFLLKLFGELIDSDFRQANIRCWKGKHNKDCVIQILFDILLLVIFQGLEHDGLNQWQFSISCVFLAVDKGDPDDAAVTLGSVFDW